MKIKKLISALLIGSVVACGATIANAGGIEVYVDNEKTALSDGTGGTAEPFIQDGTTYVPLRGVSEALGCKVEWDGNNRTVKIYQNKPSSGSVFRNSGDDIKVYIDDEQVELKDANGGIVKPFIIDGTTFIPLRGVSQALGCFVRWDGSLQRVSVYNDIIPPDGVTLSENKPYEMSSVFALYELNGDKITIDNSDYSNALQTANGPYEGYALFNTNGKYEKLSFVFGNRNNDNERIEAIIIVDGKIVDTYIIEENEPSKYLSVDIDNGLQLKIILKGWSAAMGNIVFH